MKKNKIIITLLFLIFLLFTGCGKQTSDDDFVSLIDSQNQSDSQDEVNKKFDYSIIDNDCVRRYPKDDMTNDEAYNETVKIEDLTSNMCCIAYNLKGDGNDISSIKDFVTSDFDFSTIQENEKTKATLLSIEYFAITLSSETSGGCVAVCTAFSENSDFDISDKFVMLFECSYEKIDSEWKIKTFKCLDTAKLGTFNYTYDDNNTQVYLDLISKE